MPRFFLILVLLAGLTTISSCTNNKKKISFAPAIPGSRHAPVPFTGNGFKTIHVRVALCDNKYQGIVPVSAKTGNGQDPENNLYWGWGYGVRTYFKNSKEWVLLSTQKINDSIPERLVFKHKTRLFYLIADAYDGRFIRTCTSDFLTSLAGHQKDTIQVSGHTIGISGNAALLAYIGHNGLMDFELPETDPNTDQQQRDCIILACISKTYFSGAIKQANAHPLLWTSGLMGPEAYTLHDALTGYVMGEDDEAIRNRAAKAYSKYTNCSFKAARNLLLTGW